MSKKKVTEQLWEAIDGSIYVVEPEDVKIEFTGKTIKVKRSIAFNVGQWLALHIVETHNARLLYEVLGIIPGSIWSERTKEKS